jgi:hypothetical protein
LAGDFAPRTPLNRPRFGGFSSCSSSWPRGPRSTIPFGWEHFSRFLWGRGCIGGSYLSTKFCWNPWGESGGRAMGSWGLTRSQIFWEGRSNRHRVAV